MEVCRCGCSICKERGKRIQKLEDLVDRLELTIKLQSRELDRLLLEED